MEFVCYSAWEQLPASAATLFAQAQTESLFSARPWLEILTAHALAADESLALACVINGPDTLAILPLVRDSATNWRSLAHNYTSSYRLILAPDDQPAILECLARGLSHAPCKSLQLHPIDAADQAMLGLQQAMAAEGFECHRRFRFYNWIHPVQGQSFRDYLAARPAKLRNTIARKQRKLEREHAWRIRLYTGDEAAAKMSQYDAVYRASWKAEEQFSAIMASVVARFSQLAWSRLAVLYIDDKPAAAQLWFVVARKAYIFRLAYDQTWKHYSPGSILTGYLMEYVVDTDQVREIDFLVGNEQYKQDWMSDREERWSLTCVRRSRPKRGLKRWLASLTNRPSSA